MSDARKLEDVRRRLIEKGWTVKTKGMKDYLTHPEIQASVRIPSVAKSTKTIQEVEKAVARIEKKYAYSKNPASINNEDTEMSNVAQMRTQETPTMTNEERDSRLFKAEGEVKLLREELGKMSAQLSILQHELEQTQRCVIEGPKQDISALVAETLPHILKRMGIALTPQLEIEMPKPKMVRKNRRDFIESNFGHLQPGQSHTVELGDEAEAKLYQTSISHYGRSCAAQYRTSVCNTYLTVIRIS